MSNTDKTTKLIRWQRITIVVLFLASLSVTFAAAHQTWISKARLKENLQLKQRVSEYEDELQRSRQTPADIEALKAAYTFSGTTTMQQPRLMPADIEYLQWFKEFDQSCRKMSKMQAELIGRELHSSEEDSLEPVLVAARNQWLQSLSRFRKKSPPPACEALAVAYGERLRLMPGQLQPFVSMQMMISSQIYNIDSPQGRKWSKTPGILWESEQRIADLESLRATTTYLNVELEQIARIPGAPLPRDLAKLRIGWVGVFLD